MAASTVDLLCDPHLRRFSGTTSNVQRLSLRLNQIDSGKPIAIDIDGVKIADIRWPLGDTLLLAKTDDGWHVVDTFPPQDKSPVRSSGFKNAFDHQMVFVYGTKGNLEENLWAQNRARFDAEAFYYRGNGAVDVMPDTAFGGAVDVDKSVVLYGNATTNAAWKALLPASPIEVKRGQVGIGTTVLEGADFAVLFTRPRPGSLVASVAVIGGSGMAGMRLTERLNYFSAGVAFPDFFVAEPSMLTSGYSGVRAVGFFATDWTLSQDLAIRR
jgi:hypothetical protein